MATSKNKITISPDGDILASISNQIADLHQNNNNKAASDAVVKQLQNLQALGGIPGDIADPTTHNTILKGIINQALLIQGGTASWGDSGSVLGDINTLKSLMSANQADPKYVILTSIISQVQQLLSPRPDVSSVISDLKLLKDLAGGPADAVAFHDFNVLQIAFENIWVHAFDRNLLSQVENLYKEAYQVIDYSGANFSYVVEDNKDETASLEDDSDLQNLNDFIDNIQTLISGPVPEEVYKYLPEAIGKWNTYTQFEKNYIIQEAVSLLDQDDGSPAFAEKVIQAQSDFTNTLNNFDTINSQNPPIQDRLQSLLFQIGQSLAEPYSFDIFAPNSYNFGTIITYRQEWQPIAYQAGDLRATIPLAPGETKKYSKKVNIKKTRSVKEAEKSSSDISSQSTEVGRAETEIMNKATSSTNFKLTSKGSVSFLIGDVETTTEFSMNHGTESANNKKNFHETTLKAAEEYRQERSLEIDTSFSEESDTTTTSEISNPNNEITVTYLFYELQRRYAISESINSATPVILVAQEVPNPNDIDESWLVQYQWILSRVLLDDSFRPALNYLTTGFAGDEVSLEVIKAQWEAQKDIAASLQEQVNDYLIARDDMGSQIKTATNTLYSDFSNLDLSGVEAQWDLINSLQTRIQNIQDQLPALQKQLAQAASSFEKASNTYAAALQQQYNRHITIDQLRVHVKQNIFYYMQAIWDYEPSDQRYFRLYMLPITCPGYNDDLAEITTTLTPTPSNVDIGSVKVTLDTLNDNLKNQIVYLKDIADLDRPLGYKGNYIIFALKKPLLLTTYMMQEFISDEFGINDPDPSVIWPAGLTTLDQIGEYVASQIQEVGIGNQILTEKFINYINSPQNSSDEIIVPTGQLFIEALTGTHSVLEDFKLLHRAEDVLKVKAENRHAELENLRLAARLYANQNDPSLTNLLEEPNIEKKVVIEGSASVQVGS